MPTYIVRAGDDGPVKIGWAEDTARRVAEIQTGHYETLHVIREIDTWWHSEAQFHKEFAHLRLRGEWFEFDADMMTFIPPLPSAKAPRNKLRSPESVVQEARALLDGLIEQQGHNTLRPEAFRRVAATLNINVVRLECIYYGKRLIIHPHEMDALRAAATAGREIGEVFGGRADHGGAGLLDLIEKQMPKKPDEMNDRPGR